MIEVVNAEMLRALRVVSVERGHDPRDFALVAFGGAGPLHACALADELGMPDSARARRRPACSRRSGSSRATSGATTCAPYVRPLDEAGELPADGEADLRYRGQSFELTVPLGGDLASASTARTRQRYGYADRGRPIELVAVRTADVAPVRRSTFPPEQTAATVVGPARARAATARPAGCRGVGRRDATRTGRSCWSVHDDVHAVRSSCR